MQDESVTLQMFRIYVVHHVWDIVREGTGHLGHGVREEAVTVTASRLVYCVRETNGHLAYGVREVYQMLL